MNEHHFTVFICEDDTLARLIIGEHMGKEKITYCNMLPPETYRQALIAVIEAFEKNV